MGLEAEHLLDLIVPRDDKRLLVIVETDGCFADGVSVSTGCGVGRRTLRVEDYGKVAATFIDIDAGKSVRIAPGRDARKLARGYAPQAQSRWQSQLIGYQQMPAEELFTWQPVTLVTPVAEIVGRPGSRTKCDECGEEIINQREIPEGNKVKCQSCGGDSYYKVSLIADTTHLA